MYRYQLFRSTAEHIVGAFHAGFYLEAVTLIESVLGERFESRLQYHDVQDPGFHTLGYVIKSLRRREKEGSDFKELLERADQWRLDRNCVLHEIAKTAEGDRRPFRNKLKISRAVVLDGTRLLLDFHELDEAARKRAGKRPPASSPDAFEPLKGILLDHEAGVTSNLLSERIKRGGDRSSRLPSRRGAT
jgi:hypothetical protein